MRLAFIGGGNMGGSILLAIFKTNIINQKDILVIEPDAQKRQNLSQFSGCEAQEKIDEKIAEYDILILAVKPQVSKTVMAEMKDFLNENQIIVSVMAGVSMQAVSECTGLKKVVRVMPNLPTLIEQGTSVFYAAKDVTLEERVWVNKLFSTCGICLEANSEDAIDASTAVSGSGPGYVFYFAEQMVVAAMQLGFSEEDAHILTRQTIKGAVLLWETQNVNPGILRQSVCSPGGTTLAALSSFDENEMGSNIQEGMQKAYQRAKELSA